MEKVYFKKNHLPVSISLLVKENILLVTTLLTFHIDHNILYLYFKKQRM